MEINNEVLSTLINSNSEYFVGSVSFGASKPNNVILFTLDIGSRRNIQDMPFGEVLDMLNIEIPQNISLLGNFSPFQVGYKISSLHKVHALKCCNKAVLTQILNLSKDYDD